MKKKSRVLKFLIVIDKKFHMFEYNSQNIILRLKNNRIPVKCNFCLRKFKK